MKHNLYIGRKKTTIRLVFLGLIGFLLHEGASVSASGSFPSPSAIKQEKKEQDDPEFNVCLKFLRWRDAQPDEIFRGGDLIELEIYGEHLREEGLKNSEIARQLNLQR